MRTTFVMSQATYYCVNFLHDGTFRSIDSMPAADQSDLAFDVTASRWRNIDLASSLILHITNRLTP